MKFNERYDALYHFVLKHNELYRRAFKAGHFERLVVCDYNAAEIIEKVHALEHAGYSKTFAKIKHFYYEINKQMFQWLLERCAACLNRCRSKSLLRKVGRVGGGINEGERLSTIHDAREQSRHITVDEISSYNRLLQ